MPVSNPCPSCATENPPSARFCMECGAQLERRCASCGATAPPQARFCLGRPLDAAWCDVLTARAAVDARPDDAREALDRGAATFEELGVAHMAERARSLVHVG